MTLPTSGPISIGAIAGEFGGSQPDSISEYYRGGGLVPNTSPNSNIPTSGQVSLSNYYGGQAGGTYPIYIGGASDSTATERAWTFTFPALSGGTRSTLQPGDFVLLQYSNCIDAYRDTPPSVLTSSGWTLIADTSITDNQSGIGAGAFPTSNCLWFYKFMGATPDTSVSFGSNQTPSPPGLTTNKAAIMVFTGVSTSNPIDVSVVTNTQLIPLSTTSASFDISITPITSGAVIVAGFVWSRYLAVGNSQVPLSWGSPALSPTVTNFIRGSDDRFNSILLGVQQWGGGTYTPPSVNITPRGVATDFAATNRHLVALRPA